VGGGDTNGSNELGALFVLMLPVVLELGFAEERPLLKWGLLGLVPLYVAVIAFTGSRSAFIALVIAMGILLLRSANRGRLPGNYPLVAHEYGSPEVGRDCHSTYFTMLSEVGPAAFAVWRAGIVAGLVALDGLRRSPGNHPEIRTARALAMGFEAGLIAFLVDGAFHSFGYFEYL
jgi:hypothetical protein